VTDPGTGPTASRSIADNVDEAWNLTDTGNAKRFVHLYKDIIRFAADSRQWYVWEGDRWELDVGGLRVLALTEGVVRFMRDVELASLTTDEAVTRMGRWWLASESEGHRKKMMALASLDQRLRVKENDFDADPWLLVVKNGTLDLRTGKMRPSRPEDLCTRKAAVTYDPEAKCKLWQEHVDLIMGGDVNMVAYLQRSLGYTLTGSVGAQKFWFAWGDGQNGKNVFAETVLHMLGDYGIVAPPALLTGGGGQHPTILADLRGARMVLADETGQERINDARLKMLTGSAQVKARFTGKDFFSYDSTMKLWVLGNTKPSIKDTSEGTWRRMQLVPFTVRISDDKKIDHYENLLVAERSGILNWCLEGLAAYQTLGGLGTPGVVKAAVDTYRAEEDEVGQWLEECCTPCAPDQHAVVGSLYMSYQMWCARNGLKQHEIMKMVPWGRALSGRKFGNGIIGDSVLMSINGKKVRVRRGIALATESVYGL
jgi:putative DNA primase/helicase